MLRTSKATRDKLDHVADRGNVDAVFRGLGAVDIQFPFYAGNRTRVLHVDEARHGFEFLAHDIGGRFQGYEVGRRQLHEHGLAAARAAFLFGQLDPDAGDGRGARADVVEYGVDLAALVPVAELQRDGADDIFCQLLAAGAAADVGLGHAVDAAQLVMLTVHGKDLALDRLHQVVALVHGHVAARMDLDLRDLRLDVGEELDAGVEIHERHNGPEQNAEAAEDDHDRVAQGAA
jgi:hypothetical protein